MEQLITGVIAPLFADKGEIVSGMSDSERDWFKDVLHEFKVKEVGEPISEQLVIVITISVPIKEKIRQYYATKLRCAPSEDNKYRNFGHVARPA